MELLYIQSLLTLFASALVILEDAGAMRKYRQISIVERERIYLLHGDSTRGEPQSFHDQPRAAAQCQAKEAG